MAAFQTLLNENGFDCGEADGSFGPMTQAATEAAEQAAGYKATGIGWTGLQAWLAENAQEPESDSTGEVVPSNDPLDGTKDLSSQLRNWPLNRNQDNGLVIVTQPVSGRIDNGSDDSIFCLNH